MADRVRQPLIGEVAPPPRGQSLARSITMDFAQPEHRGHLNNPSDLAEHIKDTMTLDPAVLRITIYVPQGDKVVAAASSEPDLIGRPAEPHDTRPLQTGLTDTKE